MTQNIDIPENLPIMLLPNAVLFPKAMQPLKIFEDRYKDMLQEVLHGDRMFGLVSFQDEVAGRVYTTGGVGIIRVCRENPDGTARLVLEGIGRIRIKKILQDKSYPVAKIEVLNSWTDKSDLQLSTLRLRLYSLLQQYAIKGTELSEVAVDFLKEIENPDTFIDVAAFTLCHPLSQRMELLETLDVAERYERFIKFVQQELEGTEG